MSDFLTHECGIAAIRLLKPLSYFEKKYGSPLWAFNKLFLLMEKQHNRGQDGSGIGCVKLDMPLGQPYVFRDRSAEKDSLGLIFKQHIKKLNKRARKKEVDLKDASSLKNNFDFGGEILMGHLRYGTSGSFEENACHPYLRNSNWPTRTLMVMGNFNMTNTAELNRRMIDRGQHPVFGTDTQTVLEEIGFHLDEAHTALYHKLRDQGISGAEIPEIISRELDIEDIVRKSAQSWDGGYAIVGSVGNGDFFCLRDPHGIRPCHYLLTDEILAISSERVPLMTVFEVESDAVKELGRAEMISVKNDGVVKLSHYAEVRDPKPCSFEVIYFSRGNDPKIYRQRKALGAALSDQIAASVNDDFEHAVMTFIPNTAETAYHGLLEGLRLRRRRIVREQIAERMANGTLDDKSFDELIMQGWPRGEKIAHKDIKMRTFISQEKGRAQLVSHVYDITYGAVGPKDVLVAIDDSIVRGTTLKQSILRMLQRTHPKKIVIASTAPQIRYPDFYGIDMSELGKMIAFQAAISLLKKNRMKHVIDKVYQACLQEINKQPEEIQNCVKAIYEPFTQQEISDEIARLITPEGSTCPVEVIFQSIENLHESINAPCGDWYFSGDFPTSGGRRTVNLAFINWIEGKNGRSY